MNITSTIFFACVFITYSDVFDQLPTLQSTFVTAASSGTNVLKLGANSFQITYATVFIEFPKAFPALCQFSSPMTSVTKTYDVNVKISGLTKSKFTLQITTDSNWNYLSYSILSSWMPQILSLTTLQLKDFGTNLDKTAISTKQDLSQQIVSMRQTLVKFDVFIAGFKVSVSGDFSNFFLNTSINYGEADRNNSKYDKYNDYLYQLSSGTYPDGIVVSQNSVSLSLNWFGNLSSLQITLISHTVILDPVVFYKFTGGYNTISVTKSNYNISLMDPNNNKNNLGCLNTVSFYGFTCININPVTTFDANISLLYSYFTNVTSSGSTINSLSASYYFYQTYANQIMNLTQVIDVQFDRTILKTLTVAQTDINQYYSYLVQAADGKVMIRTPQFMGKNATSFLMTLEILTPLGCYQGTSPDITLTIGFSDYFGQLFRITNKPTANFFVNPYQTCTSTNATQYQVPDQRMFRYFSKKITLNFTQIIQANISLTGGDLLIFIKNLKIYQLSDRVLIDPMITEATTASFSSYYSSVQAGQTYFLTSIPQKKFSNALKMSLFKQSPFVMLELRNKVIVRQGVKYTLNLYLLDSTGNLKDYFMSPTFQAGYSIGLNSFQIINQSATLSKPFCSSAFNATSPLNTPVDQFYLKYDVPFVTSSSGYAKIYFKVKDSSVYSHMYAIRGISIKYREFFDPIARKIVQSCPQNTYLTTNTLPPACQPCYVQNKIDNGSQCICPSNTSYLNSFSICVECSRSCLTCNSEYICTSCIQGRILDTTLSICNCTIGTYDDGVNATCAKCVYSCQNCSIKANKCTSCIQGRILDTTLSICNCTIGTYDDGVNATCAKCVYSCQNCSIKANKCTSCIQGRILDTTLSICNCTIGTYDDGVNATCAKCVFLCQNCSVKANKCTSCIQGRILDTTLSICNCTIGTYDDGVNASCAKCVYSCQNCSIKANNCTSCIQGRILDNNTFMCNCIAGSFDDGSHPPCLSCSQLCVTCVSKATQCTSCNSDRQLNTSSSTCECKRGSYDNGMVVVCQTCYQSCGSCSGNAYNCTSCPIGSVLDTTTSACICGVGYFNDTTTRCGKCNNPCGNCSGNANKCTSCSNESGSTFHAATSTCKCQNGYSFSSSGICTKNNPLQISNFHPQQLQKKFILKTFLTPINNSSLNATEILNSSSCTLSSNQSSRKLESVNLKLNIIQVILISNSLVKFIVENPPFDIINALVLLNINNPNINQTSIQFTLPQLYSTQTMSSISSSTSSSVTSTVLLTILLFIMLIFYVLGYKHNHTISFIQKISFLRFNLPITASTFSFLYSLKYSYYAYGVNALQSLLSQNYLQNSNGNFYFVDQDANILRNVGIPILLSITIILLRLIGLLLFKSSQQTTSSKKYYYRTIEYIQKTIMFPIIFFGVAEMTFANMYNKADTADASIYNPSLAFSVIYVIYFAILTVATGFSKQISNYAKLELVGEYLFSIFDSIIIIQTYYTNNVLALIITIVIKCVYELFLKYTYAEIAKLDIMKVIVTAFEIALIGILSNSSTSLSSIQALFIIVVVIDLLYVLGTTILKAMDKKQKQEEGPGETHESNKEIVSGPIPIVKSMNTINP